MLCGVNFCRRRSNCYNITPFCSQYGQHMVRLEAVAEDYCASYLSKRYFHIWQDYVTNEQIALWQKEQQADEHNQW